MIPVNFDRPMAPYIGDVPNNEDPAVIQQQRQQAQYLIDFFEQLPLLIKAKAPPFDGDVMAKADSIRLWMSQSKAIRTFRSLELARSRLTHLPPEIGLFHNLRRLDLSDNQLAALPVEIGHLAALTMLDLSNNQLAALPAEIGHLAALTMLDLRHNQLAALPAEIGNLAALTRLYLSYNQLAALPAEIGNLAALRMLHLTNNQLAALPAEIGNLAGLRLLDSSHNQLAALPAEIGNLAALTFLGLRDNQLAALPAEIGNFAALTTLYLDNNRLAALPAEIGNLAALTSLYLDNNRLAALPAEIGNLAALTTLELRDNQLAALPIEIGNLAALRMFHLTNNQLAALPAEIGNLAALTFLSLTNNQLAALPAEIGNLAALRDLLIRNNRFAIFPREIEHLMDLQCDLPRPQISPLRVWSSEFERAFPQDEQANVEYWDSRTMDFSPLESLPLEENQSFMSYLRRLRETRDYRSGGAAQNNVILRVERMVQLACKNPEFKHLMLAAIAEGLESCGDRVLITFNEIEIQWQFHHKKLTDDEFKSLAIRASRYQCLTKYAKTIAAERGLGDVIETILFYHIHLREPLDLPITTEGMLYPAMAGVTPEMFEEAKGIMMSYSDEHWLVESDHWQARIVAQHSNLAEEVNLKYASLLETVEEYYNCDQQNRADWLAGHADPVLHEILRASDNYNDAAKLVGKKWEIALMQLGAAAAAAQE